MRCAIRKSIAELKRKHFPSSKTDVREINSVRYFEQIRGSQKIEVVEPDRCTISWKNVWVYFVYITRSVGSRYA